MGADRWEKFYAEYDYDRCAYLAGEEMVEYAERFFETVGIPDAVVSVGCGPAVTEFELARRYPDTEFRCFDVARRVVEDDRELAREEGLDNIAFEVGALPDLDLERRYDLVYCVATLFFVEAVEDALLALYDGVVPGGHLVVSYPDRDLREWVRERDEFKRSFFELVDEGRNLLTAREVEDALGVPVEDYWDVVGAPGDHASTVVATRPAEPR